MKPIFTQIFIVFALFASISMAKAQCDNPLVNNITTTALNYCSPAIGTLAGTAATGGNGTYTYNWQVSTDGGESWNNASGTRTNATYSLPTITNATAFPVVYMFRRQVTSGSCSSDGVTRTLTVHPAISNNTITAPTNPVCFGTAPGVFTQTTPTGGNGAYSYSWERATNAGFTTDLTSLVNTQSFTETSTTLAAGTYYYRRTVSTAGTGCANTSNVVTVTVQAAIVNTIGGTQTICHNTTPTTLTNTTTSGGSGTYTYLWQVNIDGAGWNDAPGTNNTQTYSPPALTTGSTNTVYAYRRLVTSGACAVSTSTAVTVTVKPYATLSNVTNASGEVEITAVTYGQSVSITPVASNVTNPVFKYWKDANKTIVVVSGGNITISGNTLTETKIPAGVYSTNSGGDFPTRYYVSVSGTNYCDNLTAVPVKITVNKATLTVTADAKTKVYGNANPPLTATITGYQNSETFATAGVTGTAPTLATTATATSPVSPPTYPITLTGGAYAATNYNFNYVNNILTVTARPITIKANDDSKQYSTIKTFVSNASNVTLTAGTLASGDAATEATLTSTGSPATAVATTTYPIVITSGTVKILNGATDVTNNYNITRANGTLTVTKVPLTYRAMSLSKEYGSTVSFLTNGTAVNLESGTLVTNHALTAATVTSPGQPANAAVAGSPYATTITNGTIVIKDNNGTGVDLTANYDLTLLTGTITITAQPITIKANNDTKTYGDVKTFATNGTAVALSVGGPLLSGESITAATVTSTGSVTPATVAGTPYPIVITPGTVQIFNGATNVTANYIITLANGALTVNPRAITVTPNFGSKPYGTTYTYGTAASAVTVTGLGIATGQTLSAVSISSSGTVNTAPVITSPYYTSIIGVGTIVIRDAGNADVTTNYTITRAPGQLQVTKVTLTVTAANKNKTYDGLVFPGPYTIASYSGFVNSEDENTPGVLGGSLAYGGTSQTALNASGTAYPIVPSGLTATNYTISYVNGGLTISQKAISINSSAMTKVYGSTRAYTLADASVDAGTPVASGDALFSVSQVSTLGDPAKANVTPMGSPYTVVISNAVIRKGGTDVTANYNITYNNGTLAVTLLAINVKANPVSKVYGDVYTIPTNGSNVSTNGTSLVSGQTFTASTVTVANSGNLAPAPVVPTPGPYTLTPTAVTIRDGATDVTANYTITYQTDVLTVTKRQLTVTAKDVTKTYGTLHTFANTTSEVTVTGVSTPNLATGNTITALTLTSTSTPANAAASGTPYPIVIANNSVVIRDGSNVDVTENYDITSVNGGLTINKAALTFTAKNATKVYGDTYTFATDGSASTMTAGSLVNGNTISVNPVVTATNSGATAGAPVSGTYATQITTNSVTIIDPANSNANVTSNYDITLVPGTFTITKRQLTVTAKDVTKTYGTLHTFANTASEVTVTGVSTPALAATNAISGITLTSTGTPANAAASTTPYPIVITNNSVVIRDGSNADVTANYDIIRVNGGLPINKAALTFIAKDVSKVYGDTYTFATNGTATTMTGSLVNGNTISVNPVVTATNSGATAVASVSGTYATQITTNSVTIIDPANSNANVTSNYDITLVPGTFTITKRQLTVTAKDVTKTYGTLYTFANTLSEVTVTGVSTPNLATGNTITALTLTSTGTPANAAASITSYPIVITNNSVVIRDGSNADVTANYDITSVSGGLTINKAVLTFTAKDVSKVYGDTYTFATNGTATTMTGSLVNGNTISVNPVVTATNSGATAAASVSGTYATQITTNSVTIIDPANSNANVTSNYDITLVPGTFTITKRQLTVTAKDVTKTYGTLHTFANTASEVTVTGVSTPNLATGNTITALTLTSTGTPANAAASTTPYPIVITNNSVVIKDGNGSGTDVTVNYDITRVSGELTINKAAQSIVFEELQSKTTTSPDFVLVATASSNLPVSYTSSNQTVATVYQDASDGNKWKVKIIGEGTTAITAQQEGDSNYFAAGSVVQNLLVNNALPVGLTSYTAKTVNQTARLDWTLSSEKDNSRFIIYRSGADKNFMPIARVLSLGNTNSLRNYSFVDKQPLNGANYYQLSQIDLDGKEQPLGERFLNFSFESIKLKVYPNPTVGKLNIVFAPAVYHQLKLVDMMGRVLEYHSISPALTELKLHIEKYPPGTYVIVAEGKNGRKEVKVAKQ